LKIDQDVFLFKKGDRKTKNSLHLMDKKSTKN